MQPQDLSEPQTYAWTSSTLLPTCRQGNSRTSPHHKLLADLQGSKYVSNCCTITTQYDRLDQLLGGQGWASGEVSEICGSSGVGKTQLCLMTMVLMLFHNRTSQAIWIDTLDGGFSAQRASDVVRAHIQQRQQEQAEENEQSEGDALVEVDTHVVSSLLKEQPSLFSMKSMEYV